MNTLQPLNLALFFVCCVLFVLSAFAKAEPQASNPLKASIQVVTASKPKPSIRLDAKEKPLGQILGEVAKKTGALIHYSKLSDAPVTASCKGDNVGQVMDCLVGKQFSMIAKPSENNKPAEFWLVGTCEGNCQSTALAPTPVQDGTSDDADQAKVTQEQTEEMLKLAQSKNADERFSAINNLAYIGAKDDPNVDKALRDAMTDEDTNVRVQAISSIVQRDGDDVADQLGQALKDKSANVRMSAVSVATDANVLQQALNDSDPGVRGLAQSRLDVLTKNQH